MHGGGAASRGRKAGQVERCAANEHSGEYPPETNHAWKGKRLEGPNTKTVGQREVDRINAIWGGP